MYCSKTQDQSHGMTVLLFLPFPKYTALGKLLYHYELYNIEENSRKGCVVLTCLIFEFQEVTFTV